jgi:hypothetical protein
VTAPLTCSSLYVSDPTVRALIDVWVTERRCPLPLVDALLEYGLTNAAECARWAATEPDRSPPESLGCDERSTPCGPYPRKVDKGWYWVLIPVPQYAHDVPTERFSHVVQDRETDYVSTPHAAIVWLLDAWLPEPRGV